MASPHYPLFGSAPVGTDAPNPFNTAQRYSLEHLVRRRCCQSADSRTAVAVGEVISGMTAQAAAAALIGLQEQLTVAYTDIDALQVSPTLRY